MTVPKVLKVLGLAAAVVVGAPVLLVAAMVGGIWVANRPNGHIVSGGARRDYQLHVPPGLDRARPVPLVISLHGAMNWPGFQEWVTRWDSLADARGFIVVYPGGTGTGPRIWSMEGSETPARMPDVVFIADLIDTLAARYAIDPARIYVNGFSNGGGMAFALSCTLAGRIAAVGAVSAAQSLPWAWCPDSTPVPMIAFHGTADHVVPYGGGRVWIAPRPFPSVRDWVADWARRNRCAGAPADSSVAVDAVRTTYGACADDAAVVLYSMQGHGHQWPGGPSLPWWMAAEMRLYGLPLGTNATSISATALMWDFFEAHPRRRTAS